jgi:hypothetical protein
MSFCISGFNDQRAIACLGAYPTDQQDAGYYSKKYGAHRIFQMNGDRAIVAWGATL